MTNDRDERLFDGLVRRAFVPKGFRPQTPEEVEAMLEALGHVEISDDKCDRILQKAKGERPFDCEAPIEPIGDSIGHTTENAELAAMFRSEGEELPPGLADRLSELEDETEAESDLGGDDEDEDG